MPNNDPEINSKVDAVGFDIQKMSSNHQAIAYLDAAERSLNSAHHVLGWGSISKENRNQINEIKRMVGEVSRAITAESHRFGREIMDKVDALVSPPEEKEAYGNPEEFREILQTAVDEWRVDGCEDDWWYSTGVDEFMGPLDVNIIYEGSDSHDWHVTIYKAITDLDGSSTYTDFESVLYATTLDEIEKHIDEA